jgi:hypothetical protein
MSQVGAENMAKAGKGYAEILAFYYPGTTLIGDYGKATVATVETGGEPVSETRTKGQTIIDFMREQVGEPYDLGDHGPDKWDCSGLTMEAVKLIGLNWKHSSNTQWDEGIRSNGYFKAHGKIATMPADKVTFLFNYGKRTNGEMGMVHVAAYDPIKQSVIQAGGYLGKGVHEDPFAKAKRYFTHWGALDDTAGEPVDPSTTYKPTLRKGDEGEWVRTLQILLNQNNTDPPLEPDGKFGTLTDRAVREYQKANNLTVDGVVGGQTWGELLKEEPPEILYTAQLFGLTRAEADELTRQYPNAIVKQG